MKKEILRVQKLSKSNQGKYILNNFHMNLYEGEILGMIGLNDSGKSLLLNILSGKEPWDSGMIFYDEEPISWLQLNKINKIQLIDDQAILVPTLSVLENIFIIQKHAHKKIFIRWGLLKKQFIYYLVEDLGINIDLKRIVSTLSNAEQLMVKIVKAYILGAKIIIIENMIDFLTNEEQKKFQFLINRLKQKKISFIITGYYLALLRKYADRILFIDKGSNVKIFKKVDIGNFDEDLILLGDTSPESKHFIKNTKKRFDEIIFEACHISTCPEEDISFQIKRGEITVILDLHHSTNVNIINAILGKIEYDGNFCFNGKVTYNIAKKRSSIVIVDNKLREIEVKSLDLKDNLCLSAFPRISRFGFINFRQRKQIMNDFLKIYREHGFQYEFDIHSLTQSEAVAIYIYRILIQKWKLLLCTAPELLFSYETMNLVNEQLRLMTENGRAICIFASSIEPYINLADYFYIIQNGKVQGKYSYDECQRILLSSFNK